MFKLGEFGWEPSAFEAKLFSDLIEYVRDKPYINYTYEHAADAYCQSSMEYIGNHDKSVHVPYQLIVDYSKVPHAARWGKVTFEDRAYVFPPALAKHKKEMVEDFKRREVLKKGNQPAPRVARLGIQPDGTPHFHLQEAHYEDQVGTNLSIDYPLSSPVPVNDVMCETVRKWDIAQAGGTCQLPGFQQSRLANTIGIAVGLSARSRKQGRTFWLRRKRSRHVAVYPGMWHLPFSFALCMDADARHAPDMQTLIKIDLRTELSEELGLELSDFGELKPLAFCRDLARGGKPQFFIELPALISLEEFQRKSQQHRHSSEYDGTIETIENEKTQAKDSPELSCFRLLTRDIR